MNEEVIKQRLLDNGRIPLEEINYSSQLFAIRDLLYRQERADRKLLGRIEEADEVARRTRGRANEHAVDHWVGLVEMSCYQDAAHSMAAVGMLAPFIESVFQSAFCYIGDELPWGKLVKNIVKRVKNVGMEEYLPEDLEPTLSALFEYRNNMFHGGFEWSSKRLKKFERLMDENGWTPEWFSMATSDDEPWMFYMTSAFIEHCLEMAEKVIKGIEQFCLEKSGLIAQQETLHKRGAWI